MCFLIMSGLRIMMDNHIIPECYIDTNLVETLVPPTSKSKGYNHQKGCSVVTDIMKKKFSDKFVLGILDKDKQELPYLSEFELLDVKYDVELYKHNFKHHYIIRHPNTEKWLISECQQVDLNIADYINFNDFKDLRKKTKSKTSKYDNELKSLFRDLKKNNATGIMQLLKWTDYLKTHSYQADINLLKGNTL